jgi:uncharacterized protein with PIN domain
MAQTSLDTLKPADRREIVKLLLENVSKNNKDKIIYVSTKNLPPEIQSDFSEITNVKIQLVSAEDAANQNRCHYQFGSFNVSNKKVSVSFGDCKAGLAYNFKKVRGKWKSVPYVIEK